MYKQVIAALKKVSSPAKAKASSWFFKTGAGQYGEGDIFIGVTMPEQRIIAKKYTNDVSLNDIAGLLADPTHEYRMTALIMLVSRFQKEKTVNGKKEIFDFYLSHRDRINNWDLVDCSAEYIVGAYLEGRNKKILETLARADRIWDRRIAMVATFHDIKSGDAAEALKIGTILLHDKHDLIQKAVGWMLREVGKRCDEKILTTFLDEHAKTMPRTALRYAIERLAPEQKSIYLKR